MEAAGPLVVCLWLGLILYEKAHSGPALSRRPILASIS
jgi:hypothetical protein